MVFAVSGFGQLNGFDFFMMLAASVAYIVGVQVSTIVIHLPLNNKLQRVDADNCNEEELKAARLEFEHRWNRSNEMRTAVACGVSLILIVLTLKR